MKAALTRALEERLGRRIVRSAKLPGGDINQAFAIELDQARSLFVKTHDAPPAGMFGCEAEGLCFLAEAKALRVPEVVLWSDGEGGAPAFLVLERIASGKKRADFDEQLGRGLAALHRFGAPCFGLDHDNYIGVLEQRNTRKSSWAEFYAQERLLPQLERATRAGLLPSALARRLERLCERLDERLGPSEPPARLHGDLWSGNVMVDEQGSPCLVDPAVYGGHREVDLAMMQLFGGFSPRVFSAYDEVFARAPGHEERVPLHQLYPLLVHVNLFGGPYVSSLERALCQSE